MAHGVELILSFNITQATFLVPNIAKPLTSEELIAIRTRQLQKREADLEAIQANLLKSRFASVRQFERDFEHTICDHDFKPGALVLVRNSSIKTDLGRKSKPRYLGPMLVVRRSCNGAYHLAELDGAVSKLRFAVFRLVPYHTRFRTSIPVTRVVDHNDFAALVREELADEDVVGEEEGGVVEDED
ncbi:hypothetical protein BV25DRAFT_1798420 [Artomyces pyxidatus]|uniref:Uncharacterized protein n=1 Tax=Artomyces pyxidatus TaxID=48021 RepID=A0ACB8TAX0_9AGAM|nr:hypothetical protein BV25DRAFT_1798420 [Artomyces pyxidatus]